MSWAAEPPQGRRLRRLNELFRDEISDLLRRQAKDPRLGGLITVTEVAITPDLRQARVFVSILGSPEEGQEALQGLHRARGFFRRELGHRLDLRRIPDLSFEYDPSLERGAHLLSLMNQVLPPTPPQALADDPGDQRLPHNR